MSEKTTIRRKGFAAERELVLHLWRHGFAAMRAPASGARAKRVFYPDVIAIYRGKIFVFEVKRRKKLATLSLEKKKVENLLDFAKRAGAVAYIAIKISSIREWMLVRLDNTLTDKLKEGKKFTLASETIKERGISLKNFIREVTNKQLDSFVKY